MTDAAKPAAPPVPVPEETLALVAGGQSLHQIYLAGLISEEQYNWLSQHPAGPGGR